MNLTKREIVRQISEETGLIQSAVFTVVQKTPNLRRWFMMPASFHWLIRNRPSEPMRWRIHLSGRTYILVATLTMRVAARWRLWISTWLCRQALRCFIHFRIWAWRYARFAGL